jgi:hypothetical protein
VISRPRGRRKGTQALAARSPGASSGRSSALVSGCSAGRSGRPLVAF